MNHKTLIIILIVAVAWLRARIDGLPFLLRSISGDLVYGCLMFGIVEWTRRFEKLQIDGQPST